MVKRWTPDRAKLDKRWTETTQKLDKNATSSQYQNANFKVQNAKLRGLSAVSCKLFAVSS